MVSSGGSTPSTGEGSVGNGSGSDDVSGPDPTGSTASSSQPIPSVSVSSSGGALTSGTAGDPDRSTDGQQSGYSASQESTASNTTTTEQAVPAAGAAIATPVRSVEPVTSVAAVTTAATSLGEATDAAPDPVTLLQSDHVVVHTMSTIPIVPTTLGVGGGDDPDFIGGPAVSDPPVDVEDLSARIDSVPDAGSDPSLASLRIVTSVLAAALAPFVVPVPGSPVQEPTLWAIFAWARRQSERNMLSQRPGLVTATRPTELVGPIPEPATATVDRIEQVTGRVTGRVSLAREPDGSTYALGGQIDRRLGTVTVDGATGQWTFTPTTASRLAARLSRADDAAAFSVVGSDGTTVDVSAPVVPAEAAVTDTIDVGKGLTYGLAVVGDRLYVLNSTCDSAGNGFVKMIDTSTKAVAGYIQVGSMPFALAVSGHSLYVGNAGDGTVSVVDVATNRVVDRIDVGATPFGLEATDHRLYVADHAGTVSVIDLTDNTEIARIPIDGDPFGVAATADRVYVTDYVGGTVAVFDQATNTAYDTIEAPGTNPVGVTGYPYFAAVVGGRLYVANSATNALTIVDKSVKTVVDVDPVTRAVDAIPSGAAPVDIIVRGDRLYVSNVNCGTVTVIDVATNQPVETIRVGIAPGLMAATPDGRTIYVADVMDGTVRVITSVHPEVDDSAR